MLILSARGEGKIAEKKKYSIGGGQWKIVRDVSKGEKNGEKKRGFSTKGNSGIEEEKTNRIGQKNGKRARRARVNPRGGGTISYRNWEGGERWAHLYWTGYSRVKKRERKEKTSF